MFSFGENLSVLDVSRSNRTTHELPEPFSYHCYDSLFISDISLERLSYLYSTHSIAVRYYKAILIYPQRHWFELFQSLVRFLEKKRKITKSIEFVHRLQILVDSSSDIVSKSWIRTNIKRRLHFSQCWTDFCTFTVRHNNGTRCINRFELE